MSAEDIEFERFSTMSVFAIREEYECALKGKPITGVDKLVLSVIKAYGNVEHKINFLQNLRSQDDFVYKHAISVSILSALISGQMNTPVTVQTDIIKAALFQDLGYMKLPREIRRKNFDELEEDEKSTVKKVKQEAVSSLPLGDGAKKMIMQNISGEVTNDKKLFGTKVLEVATAYDNITAMSLDEPPKSEIYAIKKLIENNKDYDEDFVNALIKAINIIVPGVCVELSNGEKALVIAENTSNILRPVVLGFNDNKIYDLSLDSVYIHLQIRDVMKTMDNRTVINKDMLDSYVGKK
jgi:HD-GYP domain-containing protein (c-di-GMP phosphodiesterase class II)